VKENKAYIILTKSFEIKSTDNINFHVLINLQFERLPGVSLQIQKKRLYNNKAHFDVAMTFVVFRLIAYVPEYSIGILLSFFNIDLE